MVFYWSQELWYHLFYVRPSEQGCRFCTSCILKSEIPTCFRTWPPSSPKSRWNSGLKSSQVRKHVGISDLRALKCGIPTCFRTWPPSNSDVFSDLIKSENTLHFRTSGCKKSKLRIISFLRLISRSTKLSRSYSNVQWRLNFKN